MCAVIFVVFFALSVSFAIDGLVQNAILNGVIAALFGILLAYRIYKNRVCFLKRSDGKSSDC
jgi:hypothetical protein